MLFIAFLSLDSLFRNGEIFLLNFFCYLLFSLFRNREVSFFSISYVTFCFSLFCFSVRNREVLFSHFLYYLLLFSA